MILESLREFVMTPWISGHTPVVLIYKLWQRLGYGLQACAKKLPGVRCVKSNDTREFPHR